MSWEIVVGIETHTQLLTRSKMFSGAPNAFGAPPNSQASAVDIALPGVLPVLNGAAVEHAIRFGLAIGGTINRRSIFARKNYFYPDLPKGYQISQYELPIVQGGSLKIHVGDQEKTIRMTRAHLEEDAGKSLHEGRDMTGIDLNRAGTPLLEIVSEPDLRGTAEAVAYARTLHALVVWIGVCDGNMQEGSFRCDANVSVRKMGEQKLGTRCELKNLNSFRFMEQAIEFEARRQIDLLEDGGRVIQETRLYDPQKNETRSMRIKEDAQDYRYFPDPDLLPVVIKEEQIEKLRKELPELPAAKKEKYQRELGLSAYDANLLVESRGKAEFFETANGLLRKPAPKLIANWVNGELSALFRAFDVKAFAGLMDRVADGTISAKSAKDVLQWMTKGEGSADDIIEKRGLKQISDSGEIEKAVDEVLAANAKQVADYKAGKDKAFNSLVGQVMKATKGKANPAQVNEILRRKLGG
ncbi:MAG: aspartyl-tRNA(Asn)/glutamyl-tRNA(Gln) amidotransferase subunit [Betaproteobacteria bacterium]|jgi:aspartyl-tRNA(Asn)/glutamyl-tRNA(Gln) amidotransferase subunit B|nr:aspartyl-tRNA(Asn)/glutamyl-tRNA(Gln) amidotransferase subunit [Betaproteobacteria bacterium]